LFEHFTADEALIDAAQGIGKPLQHAFNRETTSGNFSSGATAVEFQRVMGHGLDAKHAFAFAIDLEALSSAP
jgi:hypothetical protein